MVDHDRPLNLKPEDSAPAPHLHDEDDVAIAVGIKDLGDIEAKIFVINGFTAEARQSIRQALNLIGPGQTRRLLHRAQRAMDDAVKVGLDVVNQTRGL